MSDSLTGACPVGAQVTTYIFISNSLRQQKLKVELYSCGYSTAYINQQSLVKMSRNISHKTYNICIFRSNSFRWIHYVPHPRVIPFNFWKSSPLFKKISKDPVQYDAEYNWVAVSNKMAIRRACEAEATLTSQRSWNDGRKLTEIHSLTFLKVNFVHKVN